MQLCHQLHNLAIWTLLLLQLHTWCCITYQQYYKEALNTESMSFGDLFKEFLEITAYHMPLLGHYSAASHHPQDLQASKHSFQGIVVINRWHCPSHQCTRCCMNVHNQQDAHDTHRAQTRAHKCPKSRTDFSSTPRLGYIIGALTLQKHIAGAWSLSAHSVPMEMDPWHLAPPNRCQSDRVLIAPCLSTHKAQIHECTIGALPFQEKVLCGIFLFRTLPGEWKLLAFL